MITIVGIASQYIHQNLGVWCLAAGLEQYGIKTPFTVVEMNINQQIDESIEKIMRTNPKIIGFSCYIWNIERTIKLIQAIKLLLPECIIVCGGPEVSFRAEVFLQENNQVSYVLKGAGEYSFYKLCSVLIDEDSKACIKEVPGLCFRQGEKVQTNPSAPLPLPAPSPYTKKCLDQVKGRIVYVETSRGCPFSCAFCLSGIDEPTIFFNLDQAKKDLLLAANAGTATVKLVDRTFNCNAKRAKELLRFLINAHEQKAFPEDICFHFEIGADLFDQETLDILAKAPIGLFQVEAGLQSFNTPTLVASRRKTNMEKLEYNLIHLLKNQNIHVHIDLIAGLPLEDFKTFMLSFKKALGLKPHMLQLGFLKLIYGSNLQEEKEEYGYIALPYPPYEILKNRWLTFDEINRLKRAEKGLEYFYNKGRFPKTVEKLLALLGEEPLLFFERLGQNIEDRGGKLSYENSCNLLGNMFVLAPEKARQELSDLLIEDILTYNNTGYLPAFLRKEETLFKKINIQARKKYPKGTKLGIGLVSMDSAEVLVANYTKKAHRVTGEYPVDRYPLKALLTE